MVPDTSVLEGVYGAPRVALEGITRAGVQRLPTGAPCPFVRVPRTHCHLSTYVTRRAPRCFFAASDAFWTAARASSDQEREQPRAPDEPIPLREWRALREHDHEHEVSMSEYGVGVRALLTGATTGWDCRHVCGAALVLAHSARGDHAPVLNALAETTDPLVYFPGIVFMRARTLADLGVVRPRAYEPETARVWGCLPDIFAAPALRVLLAHRTHAVLDGGRYLTADLAVFRYAARAHLASLLRGAIARFADRAYISSHPDLARAVYLLPDPVFLPPAMTIPTAFLPACVSRALTPRRGKDHLDNDQRLFLGYLYAKTRDERFRPTAAVKSRPDMKTMYCSYVRNTLVLCPHASSATHCHDVTGPLQLISPA